MTYLFSVQLKKKETSLNKKNLIKKTTVDMSMKQKSLRWYSNIKSRVKVKGKQSRSRYFPRGVHILSMKFISFSVQKLLSRLKLGMTYVFCPSLWTMKKDMKCGGTCVLYCGWRGGFWLGRTEVCCFCCTSASQVAEWQALHKDTHKDADRLKKKLH